MKRIALIAGVALGLVVLMAAAAGGAAYLVLQRVRPEGLAAAAPAPAPDAAADPGPVVKLPRFVTDLADRDRQRFVDVTLSIKVRDEQAARTAEELMPQVRDAVLGHLRGRTAAELAGAAGKDRLAEALTELLNGKLPGGVRRVYITDLLVQ